VDLKGNTRLNQNGKLGEAGISDKKRSLPGADISDPEND